MEMVRFGPSSPSITPPLWLSEIESAVLVRASNPLVTPELMMKLADLRQASRRVACTGDEQI